MLFMKMVRNFCILGGKVLKKREIRYHSYFGYSQFPLGYRLFESNEFIPSRSSSTALYVITAYTMQRRLHCHIPEP